MGKRARRLMEEDHKRNKEAYIRMGEVDVPDGRCQEPVELPDSNITVRCRRIEGHDGPHWDGLLYNWGNDDS